MKNHLIPVEVKLNPSDKVLELNQVLPINDSSGKIVDLFIPKLWKINLNNSERMNTQIELPSESMIEYDRLLLKVYKCSFVSSLLAGKIGEIYEMIKNENSADDEIVLKDKLDYFIKKLRTEKLFPIGVKELYFKQDKLHFCNRLEAFFFRGEIFKGGVPCIIEGDNKTVLKIRKDTKLSEYSYYSLTEDILKSYFNEYLELNRMLNDLETNYSSFMALFD